METDPQRQPKAEIPLLGGQLTPGIVRVGNTVRRPPKGNAAFVHDLLIFLEDRGFPFVPRFLGMDEQGRDILSYLEGETWPDSGSGLSDDLMEETARAIRCYHDATVGSRLSQGQEIVAHHDLGPHNTIFQGGHLVGFIDWDDAAPGTRLRDLANAVYNYVDVSHWSNQAAPEQARRIHLMCVAYGWNDPLALVNDFEADVQQALRNHEQAGRTGAIKVFAEEVSWMRLRAQELRLVLRASLVPRRPEEEGPSC
jgi:Phosphotransferase enzyme family